MKWLLGLSRRRNYLLEGEIKMKELSRETIKRLIERINRKRERR